MFISFEGLEGSGKTTQIGLLASALISAGFAVVTTREPGGTPLGESIRNILLDPNIEEISFRAEALLFCAARAQLVDYVITPALEAGMIVICDRYSDSTLAYQGYGRGKALYPLRQLAVYATQAYHPDLTIYLDIDPQVGLARKAAGDLNRMDTQKIEFYQKVRAGYLELVRLEPWRWVSLAGDNDPDEIQNVIQMIVKERLNKK